MKVSLNWLREFVELPAQTSELCELLTLAGVEVEHVESRGVTIENVVVAQIAESKQHPNADRLSVCQVDDGSGTPRQIVCGAKNYRVGDKVPLALPGAVLPGDFKIKVGKLRGVESAGMLCSAKELQLAADADGLLILPETSRVGVPLSEIFPSDTVLDLEVTPNRPDLLSHAGIAREIAALSRKEFRSPAAAANEEGTRGGVTIAAPECCPFYTARRIRNVKVSASPAWLRQKLEAVGVRAINNVVDVTNFVMLEMGQPLHAFDAATLAGGIEVRTARDGEELAALDGRSYKLKPAHLLIADAERALAIAGVMGGERSGVTAGTTNVVLESAYFQPASVRRTSRELGLASDSSYRFERGVDPEGVLRASRRAAELIAEIAGGEVGELMTAGAPPDFVRIVELRTERCRALLGAEISAERIDEILTGLGLTRMQGGWRVPSFRQDLTREIDLIEEVTRVFGIENVPSRQSARFAPGTPADRAHDLRMEMRRALVARGFFETRTLSLIAPNAVGAALFGEGEARAVRNPLTSDQVALRSALIPGLLQVAAHNGRVGAKRLRLFEIGRVFHSQEPEERHHLGILLSGPVTEPFWRLGEDRDADIFDLKGVLQNVLGGAPLTFHAAASDRVALAIEVRAGDQLVGHAGHLLPAETRGLDLSAPVLVAELNLDALPPATRAAYREVNPFPAVTRDIALLLPDDVPHARIDEVLRAAGETLLERVELFDVFSDPAGARTPPSHRSLAYSLTYRAPDRTLSADEANAAHVRLKERLKAELPLSFRE